MQLLTKKKSVMTECHSNVLYNEVFRGDIKEVLNTVPEGSIDCIVTDPPYRTTPRGCAGNSGGMMQQKICKSGKMFENNDIDISEYIHGLYRVLKETGHCYIMCNHTNLQNYLNVCTECGFHFIKCLIWDKGNKIMGRFYMNSFEYILFFRKGKAVQINDCGTADILRVANKKLKDKDNNNLHNTEKPVELMETLIKNSTQKGDIVLDPFVGIGATAIASKKTGRKFLCFDISDKCVTISNERLKEVK